MRHPPGLAGCRSASRRAAAALDVAARRVIRAARRVAGAAPVVTLARLGFVAKAALYAVIGTLAVRGALGLRGGGTLDTKAALELISVGASGRIAVGAVAVGLAGLGIWFVIEGVANPERAPPDPVGVIQRVAQAVGGVGYLALSAIGARLAAGETAGPPGNAIARDVVARILAQPTGPEAAIVLGLGAFVVGARQAFLGWTRGFLRSLDERRVPAAVLAVARWLGTAGFVAQGSLLALVGVFVVRAALDRDPRHATGMAGALARIAHEHHGSALLFAAGAGLLAYAVYATVEGSFRRFPPLRGPSRDVTLGSG